VAASKAATPRDRAVRSITDAMITSDPCVPHGEGGSGVFEEMCSVAAILHSPCGGGRDRRPSCGEAKCEYVAATVALRPEQPLK
jgi:hypothetical protein